MKYLNLLAVFAIILFFSTSSSAQKMSAQDVVSKHLESIGSKEKLASVKNQVMFGDVEFKLEGNPSSAVGKVVIASSNEKNIWGMNLNSNDYPLERFGYDGKNAKIAYTLPGFRSILGSFIFSYQELLKDGLLGGSLTSSWALMHTAEKNPKLSYEGIKKVNGKEAHVLEYAPKNGSDLSIKMYFDKDNFRHLRTEYSRVIAARIGSPITQTQSGSMTGTSADASVGQSENRYKLIEDFSDYKDVGGLMIPGTYKLHYSFYSSSPTQSKRSPNREADWKFTITNFSSNQPLDANSFDIEAK